ncbi:MAG: M42 family metallopeptidase [Candidatus Bathyarchaeia archaeon]
MLNELFNLLKEFSESLGPSGYENEVVKLLSTKIKPYVNEVWVDRFSNIIAKKSGEEKGSVMIYAHIDEVGLIIKHVDEEGFLTFETLGGLDAKILPSQRVKILVKNGFITGVIGCKPPHLQTQKEMETPYKIEDLFIDIGAANRKEAESWGIKPGCSATLERSLEKIGKGNLVSGKALDDRVGCAIMVKIAEEVAKEKFDYDLYFGGTVQEELGLRGSRVMAFSITPNLGLVIDTSAAGDFPGLSLKKAPLKVDGGPGIVIMDSGFMATEEVKEFMISTAEEEKIPYQPIVIKGGTTDAAYIQLTKEGVPVGSIAIPSRYTHSTIEVVSLEDMANSVKLITAMLKRLNSEKLNALNKPKII